MPLSSFEVAVSAFKLHVCPANPLKVEQLVLPGFL